MKILEVKSLALPEVKVIRYARFSDERGYFTESYQMKEFASHEQLAPIFTNRPMVQLNENYSKPKTVRGLHSQWTPKQNKLVRTIWGRMVDVVVDIRPNSANFGRGIMYDMPADPTADFGELIWVPFGFAHGNYYTVESKIEYLVDTPWGGTEGEGGISPLSPNIDWDMCEPHLLAEYKDILGASPLLAPKDRDGMSLETWKNSDIAKTHFTS